MSLVSNKEILVHCIYTNETDQYKYLIKTKDVIMVIISTEGITWEINLLYTVMLCYSERRYFMMLCPSVRIRGHHPGSLWRWFHPLHNVQSSDTLWPVLSVRVISTQSFPHYALTDPSVRGKASDVEFSLGRGRGPRHSGVVIKTSPEKSIPGPSLLLEDHDSRLSQPIKFICCNSELHKSPFQMFPYNFWKTEYIIAEDRTSW